MTDASSAIARLRELRAKATAGPWYAPVTSEGDVWDAHANGDPGIPLMRSERGNYRSWGRSLDDDERNANAAAIVAAMNSLDALLECAAALHQLLDDLGQLAPAEPSIQAVEEARAALDALAGGGE
jgi:hypothetical protein